MSKIPNRQKIREMQKKIKEDKVIMDYTEDELKYLQSPIGSALYDFGASSEDDLVNSDYNSSDYDYEDTEEFSESNDNVLETDTQEEYDGIPIPNADSDSDSCSDKKKEKRRAHWSDRLVCKICGGEYTRSAVSAHRKTNKHQIYQKAGKKFLNILRGE